MFDLQRCGGRLTRRDDNTVVITNADFVSQQQLDAIQDEIPNLTITMQGCRTSASGFCVVIAGCDAPHPLCSAAFLEVIAAILVLLAAVATSSAP